MKFRWTELSLFLFFIRHLTHRVIHTWGEIRMLIYNVAHIQEDLGCTNFIYQSSFIFITAIFRVQWPLIENAIFSIKNKMQRTLFETRSKQKLRTHIPSNLVARFIKWYNSIVKLDRIICFPQKFRTFITLTIYIWFYIYNFVLLFKI